MTCKQEGKTHKNLSKLRWEKSRAIVIADSPVRALAAIQITSICLQSYLDQQQKLVLIDPQEPKRTKAKNCTNSTKEFSEKVEGTTQQNKGLEANRTRKLTRKFGKIFVAKVLWSTFSVSGTLRSLRCDSDCVIGSRVDPVRSVAFLLALSRFSNTNAKRCISSTQALARSL